MTKAKFSITETGDKVLRNCTSFVFKGPCDESFAVSMVVLLADLDQIQDKSVRSWVSVWDTQPGLTQDEALVARREAPVLLAS